VGYLKGFLFSPKRSATPIKALSGGERNRVILAKLFTRPANLLVLDEPTNDLDIETLEVLEQKLCEYQGTLIVVSHDRAFLDNVVTSTIVFEEDGRIREYVGGYSDWLRQGHILTERDRPDDFAMRGSRSQPVRRGNVQTKLSYKDQRELEVLPAEIEALERTVRDLQARIAAPGFYQGDAARTRETLDALRSGEARLEQRVERWAELEALRESLQSNG
jgi:ATP-binding cassette subfamily F protein uup